MDLPKFGMIRQLWPEHPEADIEGWLDAEFKRTGLLEVIKEGDQVLLTAGSRGIKSKPAVLAAIVARVKARGGVPLIYPAMGSHGGATAEGQVKVLANYGIIEENMGAPIYDGWDIVEIGSTELGATVYADRAVVDADHVILCNRIKEHTDYIGPTESGLIKIAAIGLGRQPCAEFMHRQSVNIGYFRSIQSVTRVMVEKLNIIGGVAILEDHYNQLRRLEAVPVEILFDREPELLKESQEFKPKLPFKELDLLICEEIGKEISGTGADTKVVGNIMKKFEAECKEPKVMRLVILDLSDHTYGNGTGLGLADYTTQRLVDKLDLKATAINCITGGGPELGRIPIALDTDREAIEAGLLTAGLWTPDKVKVAWITNTKAISTLAVSEALFEEAKGRDDLEAVGELFEIPLDADGNLTRLS